MIREVNLKTGKETSREYSKQEQLRIDKAIADHTPSKMEKWLRLMEETDISMPRTLEDIIDALDDHVREAIAVKTLSSYNDKKTLRSQKP
tara:strand:+ start:742 stop:1011 length:270 start_codon:yes stop_codon:yes gene_type:complete